ncbi:MAG: hypothetical protein Q9190_000631 [Brigantiaea leucoxantha]
MCPDISIDVYERNDYVGGRSTTVYVHDNLSESVELGGSIFVEVNHILVRFASDLGLPVKHYDASEKYEPDVLGVWDGERFVFTQSDASYGWWNIAKLLWKYGISPIRAQNLMKKTVGSFLKMYEPEHFPFRSLTEKAAELDLTASTALTGTQMLYTNGIGDAFAHDIVQAATRVNYAQNLEQIHGVETMVCMATDGAMGIKTGNWRIFDGMIRMSGAELHLNTSVTNITYEPHSDRYIVQSDTPRIDHAAKDTTTHSKSSAYASVVIATPFQFANITISPPLSKPPSPISYVSLHVTLFTSPYRLSTAYFNLTSDAEVPTSVLTTTPPNSDPSRPPPFFSISFLRTVQAPRRDLDDEDVECGTRDTEYLYKIFSPQPVKDSFLEELLGVTHRSPSSLELYPPMTWKYEKRWDSYPYLPPRTTFDDPRLDENGGLWYTSGIESFISTMETSALMGANVAALVVSGWKPDAEKEGVERERTEEVEL